MLKTDAIKDLGGTVAKAAKACGLTSSAISQWPEVLSDNQVDRVQAALYRLAQSQAKSCAPVSQESTHAN